MHVSLCFVCSFQSSSDQRPTPRSKVKHDNRIVLKLQWLLRLANLRAPRRLQELSESHLVHVRFVAGLLIKFVFDRVILERLVRRTLQVVGEGLQRRLQVVPVVYLQFILSIEYVVLLEKVRHVVVVLFDHVVGVAG